MKISQNIIFDKSILESEENKFYTEQLEIVSLNLDDFNRRFNSNITLTYHKDFNAFSLSTSNQKYGDLFARHIATLLAFHNDKNWNESDFINSELRNFRYIYEHLYYTIQDDKEAVYKNDPDFIHELDLFLTRNNNYYPLGILSINGQNYYKEQVQKMANSIRYLLESKNQ